jgi:hypothetical protein
LKEWSPELVTDPIQEGRLKLIASKKDTETPLKRNTSKAKEGRDQKRQRRQHHGCVEEVGAGRVEISRVVIGLTFSLVLCWF